MVSQQDVHLPTKPKEAKAKRAKTGAQAWSVVVDTEKKIARNGGVAKVAQNVLTLFLLAAAVGCDSQAKHTPIPDGSNENTGATGGSTGSGGSSGSSGSGGSAASSGAAGAAASGNCETESPVLINGAETGFSQCGTIIHRTAALQCPSELPTTFQCTAGQVVDCNTDKDCVAKPYGFCSYMGDPGAYCGCNYGCISDSDCEAGYICKCGSPVGQCVQANCTTDADCGGYQCALYTNADSDLCREAFGCLSEKDECIVDQDCSTPNSTCTYANGVRTCTQGPYCAEF